MEKLFELLFQHHPDFKEEIEGCSEEEIDVLEKLIVNTQMPEAYKVFLKNMGRNTGRVYGVRRKYGTNEPEENTRYGSMEIKIGYQSVLDYYKKIHKKKWLGVLGLAEDYGEKEEDFFMFGIDCLGNDNGHFYLDLRSPDLPVVEISGTVEFRLHSPSFRAFLFDIPFKRTL